MDNNSIRLQLESVEKKSIFYIFKTTVPQTIDNKRNSILIQTVSFQNIFTDSKCTEKLYKLL